MRVKKFQLFDLLKLDEKDEEGKCRLWKEAKYDFQKKIRIDLKSQRMQLRLTLQFSFSKEYNQNSVKISSIHRIVKLHKCLRNFPMKIVAPTLTYMYIYVITYVSYFIYLHIHNQTHIYYICKYSFTCVCVYVYTTYA